MKLLSESDQRRVVKCACSSATAINAPVKPTGISGAELLMALAVQPFLSDEEAAQMILAIEAGCGQIESFSNRQDINDDE